VREGVIGAGGAVHGEMRLKPWKAKGENVERNNDNVGGVAAGMRLLTL
jgi:hypothetical protein